MRAPGFIISNQTHLVWRVEAHGCAAALSGCIRWLRVPAWVLPVLALTGCVMVQNADLEQLPAEWRTGIGAVSSFRDPSGRYKGDGRRVDSSGRQLSGHLVEVFFPNRFTRRECESISSVDLKWDGAGKFSVTPLAAGGPFAELTLPARIDPSTGWLEVGSIPVKDAYKAALATSTASARLALSPEGTLFLKSRISGAGVMIVVPVAGTKSRWWRFEAVAATADPGSEVSP